MNNTAAILCSLSIGLNLWGKPNVLIIMTDDQGYPEISAHGNPILHTPNLDKKENNIGFSSQSLKSTKSEYKEKKSN